MAHQVAEESRRLRIIKERITITRRDVRWQIDQFSTQTAIFAHDHATKSYQRSLGDFTSMGFFIRGLST